MARYTRHFTLHLRHANTHLVRCSAVEEHPDGAETDISDTILHDDGPDTTLTVARDYLRPNQSVTLRWDVNHAVAR